MVAASLQVTRMLASRKLISTSGLVNCASIPYATKSANTEPRIVQHLRREELMRAVDGQHILIPVQRVMDASRWFLHQHHSPGYHPRRGWDGFDHFRNLQQSNNHHLNTRHVALFAIHCVNGYDLLLSLPYDLQFA